MNRTSIEIVCHRKMLLHRMLVTRYLLISSKKLEKLPYKIICKLLIIKVGSHYKTSFHKTQVQDNKSRNISITIDNSNSYSKF